VTLTDLLPTRIGIRKRPTGKHREADAVDLLQCKLTGAQLLIKGLRLQLDDKDFEHDEAVARIDERHSEVVRGLEDELAELQRRLDIACKAETVVTRTQEISLDEIRRHCVKPVPLHQAPFATTSPGRVPSWARTDDTQPIPVISADTAEGVA
jgi:hypothetical protein